MPGDLLAISGSRHPSTSSFVALENATVAAFDLQGLLDTSAGDPTTMRAFWSLADHEREMLTERLVTLGQKDAKERIAYLFLEFFARLHEKGMVRRNRYTTPLTQNLIADTTGISMVHTNRILRAMKRDGIAMFKRGEVQINDIAALRMLASATEDMFRVSSPR